jgi:hypothetical protein
LKLIAIGVNVYFKANENKFEFIITVASLLDILIVYVNFDRTFLSLIKLLRTMRFLKLGKKVKGLNIISYNF